MKKVMLAFAAVCMLLTVSAVNAQTIVTSDQVLSIETPSDAWKLTADPNHWLAISDGRSSITIDHYSNGESLPAVAVANGSNQAMYQAFVSTQNEVFVVKAMAGEIIDLEDIMKIVNSIKVLRYDTKRAITTPAASISEFGVRAINATYYVNTDGLRVRMGCSTDSQQIGSLSIGDAVNVKGAVTKNGQDYGWYQIVYQSTDAYVAAEFLSETAPQGASTSTTTEEKSSSAQVEYTGAIRSIYDADGDPRTVYQGTDGDWYGKDGAHYTQITDYEFVNVNTGENFTSNQPQDEQHKALSDPFTVFWGNGNPTTLTLYDNGYYSAEWVRYVDNGNGTYSGADGTTLYDEAPDLSTIVQDDDEYVQCEYCGFYFKAGAEYRNHICPEREAAMLREREGDIIDDDDDYDDIIDDADDDDDDYDDYDFEGDIIDD